MQTPAATYTAFAGNTRLAAGSLPEVAARVKHKLEHDELASVLIFDDLEARPVDLDWRGSAADVLARLPVAESERPLTTDEPGPASDVPRGPGRPKLGVVAREVTLLPRHWDWLAGQPGGASVALRKLVDQARRDLAERDRVRQAHEAAYRFMSAMAGNQPGFEEATRALFANDSARFEQQVAGWPADVRDYATRLALGARPADAALAG